MAVLFLVLLQLTGEILDPSGRPIPQASILLTDLETNAVFRTMSGADGRYLFSEVRPGKYSIAVEAAGFQRLVRSNVTLAAGEKIRLQFRLPLGSGGESVTI